VPSSAVAIGRLLARICMEIDAVTDDEDQERMDQIADVVSQETEIGAIMSMIEMCIKAAQSQEISEAEVMEVVQICFGHIGESDDEEQEAGGEGQGEGEGDEEREEEEGEGNDGEEEEEEEDDDDEDDEGWEEEE
jgi:hypothetical protein